MTRRALLFVSLLAATSACGRPAATSPLSEEFVARAGASQHPINGKVVRFDAAKHTVTLAHDAIPSYMDAMTMEFKVKEAWPFGIMATGTPEDVKRLAGFFGLDYFQEARSITHSLRTAIVDPAGRVYKVFEGNEWQVDEVLSALRELAATKDRGKT